MPTPWRIELPVANLNHMGDGVGPESFQREALVRAFRRWGLVVLATAVVAGLAGFLTSHALPPNTSP